MIYFYFKFNYSIKSLNIILIYSAVLIMLLHNSVAHSHAEESQLLQSCEVDSEWCLMEWLESVFQSDFGQDHLEYFNMSSDKSNDFQLDDKRDIFFGLNLLATNHSANFYLRKDIFQEYFTRPEYLANNLSQRGPPSI